ncbi:MAG: SH3 domain-containing protein [Imperialibacter sp.]|uniref:SH3 domain-containing protein n=1 Tax=Imperialibacter sp. TaxID=2038411 RepID=UPI0032EFF4AC
MDERQQLKDSGYKPEFLKDNIVIYFFIFLGGAILPVLGPGYWLYLSIRNFFKRNTKFFYYRKETTYVSDRRYKTGKRPEGYKKVKEYSDTVLKSNTNERLFYVLKGVIAFGIAGIFASNQYSIYQSWNEQPLVVTISKGIVIAEKGAHLRKASSSTAEVIMSIPYNESVEIISTDGPKETIGAVTANWLHVSYNDSSGWVWGGLIEQVFNDAKLID